MYKLGYGHKFNEDFIRRLRDYATTIGIPGSLVDWCAAEMKDRIVVGECRYGRPEMIEPDQDSTLPKGWRNGYAFFATDPAVWRNGLKNKLEALYRTLNGDLVPDVLNYAMFLASTDSSAARRVAAFFQAFYALCFLGDGREGRIEGYHETTLDQGIHGKELSGTATKIQIWR
jgi:hypothetical protein